MPENFIPDALHKNFMNGRSSPFRGLPKNEMMLMTDRRVMQFLLKVISALDEKQQSDISYDPDLTLMDFWNITQNIGPSGQGQHFSGYNRPWEYTVLPAIREAVITQWKKCVESNPAQEDTLTGEQVITMINQVVLRLFNVSMEGIRTITAVTQGKTAFQTLRDHFAKTVAPYHPNQKYSRIVRGNPWQSLIADCMYRKDNESLTHIISEGKKHAPEALSDAIADMCIGISGRVAHAEEFDRKEVHILAVCMSHMITAKEKAQSALNNIFEFYQISDQYGLYDAALDAFIAHPELQTDQAILGRGVGNWSFDQISTLVNKLKNGGVSTEYIVSRVYFCHLTNCRQDVWDKIFTLLPEETELTEHTKILLNLMRKTRKTAALESLPNSVKLDENASTYTVELPLGLYQMEQGQGILQPFPVLVENSGLEALPDFTYLKPDPTELGTWHEEVQKTLETNKRTGYKFIGLIKAPENHTWVKLPNHTHRGPGAELALVALTPSGESRFFPFDCLEEGLRKHLLNTFQVTQYLA